MSLWLTNNIHPQNSKLFKSVDEISKFIASEHFKEMSLNINDLQLVDSIYKFALTINNYDYKETLLSLTFALIPFKKVPIQIPFTKIVLNYPLISSEDSIFYLKNKNLPKYFFLDSPQNDFGDKDKLAHFFGNAYLAYSTLFFEITNFIGYFVEVFEENFKVDSKIDYRDLYVNNLGKIFAKKLKANKNILPSDILILFNIKFILIDI
ncbi:MAG: hypothetical protein STSR0008_22340 [Ignavibacterium sp.]